MKETQPVFPKPQDNMETILPLLPCLAERPLRSSVLWDTVQLTFDHVTALERHFLYFKSEYC